MKTRKYYPRPDQKDPNYLDTERVQLWKGCCMLTAQLTLEEARKMVREGKAFVITSQAIQTLHPDGYSI